MGNSITQNSVSYSEFCNANEEKCFNKNVPSISLMGINSKDIPPTIIETNSEENGNGPFIFIVEEENDDPVSLPNITNISTIRYLGGYGSTGGGGGGGSRGSTRHVSTPICGDGTVDSEEECDDGNNVNGDGCDENCKIEIEDKEIGSPDNECKEFDFDFGVAKWECNGGWTESDTIYSGTSVTGNCDSADWDVGTSPADGIVVKAGNPESGGYHYAEDGTSGTLDLDKDLSHITFCGYEEEEPVCGNGIVEGDEECDDGNNADGDGCSSTCTFECLSGMISYWRLDETSGTTAYDSYDSYDGTLNGGTWAPGQIWNGLSFDGNDYVDLGDVTQLNSVSAFTIMGWIKQDSNTANERVFDKINNGNNDISVAPYGGKIYFEVGNGANSHGYWNGYSSNIPSGTWYHLAAVYDGSGATNADKAKIYVDGVERTMSFSGTIPATTANLAGYSFTLSRPGDDFNGMMDEVALYSRALSSSEILSHYNNGLAGNGYCEECGNGILEGSEECDDSNNDNNDGCNANCNLEICGDNIVQDGISEECELPETDDNSYCSQTPLTDCNGKKYAERDAYGYCDKYCGCIDDTFNYQCVKGECSAQCDSDDDCSDCDPHTIDTCNLDTCMCEHEPQPYCGDGNIDAGEECDDGNNDNNDGCDENCNLELPDCVDADYVFDVDLGVCGDGCHSTCPPQDTESINVPVGGAYSVIGQVWRGHPGQCQTNEDFYLEINTDTGLETEDDADPCAITVRLDDLGDFTFNSGANNIIMHTASTCPPDTHANSVSLKKLCLYAEAVCGDGKLDPGEECDDGVNNGVPCTPLYGGSCTYCSDICEEIILEDGYCGDGNLDVGHEECELPETDDNSYCPQTPLTDCNGKKYAERDEYGSCNVNCGCVDDPFENYQCVKDKCYADCGNNEDCPGDSCEVTYDDTCQDKKLVDYNGNKIKDDYTKTDSCDDTCDLDACECSDCQVDCSATPQIYCVKDVCGTECALDGDCPCPDDGCAGNNYYDYPEHGECNGCMCDTSTQPCHGPCKPTISYNDPLCVGCVDDDDCNNLDDDYCDNDLVKHDEGKCVNYECTTETTTVEDCNDLDDDYCDGSRIMHDDYTCLDASCVLDSTSLVQECDNGLYCDGQETCEEDTAPFCADGTDVNCLANDIDGVTECFYDPDKIDYTWDYRAEFISKCVEDNPGYHCTTGDETISHTCDVGKCDADCVVAGDCPEKCTSKSHKLYQDVECTDCECKYSNYDCVVGKCGAQCDEDTDCNCPGDYCDGTTLVDYPEHGRCGTAGSEGCLCQVDTGCGGDCKPTLYPNHPNCFECGNGIVEGDEECDAGVNNGQPCDPPYDGQCTYCSVECKEITLVDGYCGDGNFDVGYEECEPPGNDNNMYCLQTVTEDCDGKKYGTRDDYGYCNECCGCIYDAFSYQCVKDKCYADCGNDEDCPGDSCEVTYDDTCQDKKLVDYNGNKIKDDYTKTDSCDDTCDLDACECSDCSVDCSATPDVYCVKDICGAECVVDADCDDGDVYTIDTCLACVCKHEYVPYCGDGIVEPPEECEADGLWGVEHEYTCNKDNTYNKCVDCEYQHVNECKHFCSADPECDGVEPSTMLETCDEYGFSYLEDYCDENCQIQDDNCESGYDGCTASPECDEENPFAILNPFCSYQCVYIPSVCGDEAVEGLEECDDGVNNGIPCTPPYDGSCTYCSGTCKEITLTDGYCGDNNVDDGHEECDDGNNDDNDGCNALCLNEYCGDAVAQTGEECDDGNDVNEDECRNDCTLPYCGDGITDANEECDDAGNNGVPCDPQGGTCTYCSDECEEITLIDGYCGDGVINPGEECEADGLWGITHEYTCNKDNTYNKCVDCEYQHVNECKHFCSASLECNGVEPNTMLKECSYGFDYLEDYCDENCQIQDDNCESDYGCTASQECDEENPFAPSNPYCTEQCIYEPVCVSEEEVC